MYADKDSNNNISIMELSSEEAYILTEALARYSTNPDIQACNRIVAKNIACEISNINVKYHLNHGDKMRYK